MRYLIDSSAWIEYLKGSKTGEKVNKILKENEEIFVLSIIIAEVVSKIERESLNSQLAYESMIKNAKIFDITPKISKEAGLLHAKIKQNQKSFSLADALIISSAKMINAELVTKDSHFKHFTGAIII